MEYNVSFIKFVNWFRIECWYLLSKPRNNLA